MSIHIHADISITSEEIVNKCLTKARRMNFHLE